jgi:hypothetical protein
MVTFKVKVFRSELASPFRETCDYAPAIAVGLAKKVNGPEPPELTVNGAGDEVTADGCPVVDMVTAPVKPFMPDTFTEMV